MGGDVPPVLSTLGSDSLKEKERTRTKVRHGNVYIQNFVTFPELTGKDNEEDNSNVDEEKLEISKVAEDLTNSSRWYSSELSVN